VGALKIQETGEHKNIYLHERVLCDTIFSEVGYGKKRKIIEAAIGDAEGFYI